MYISTISSVFLVIITFKTGLCQPHFRFVRTFLSFDRTGRHALNNKLLRAQEQKQKRQNGKA